MSPVIAFHVSNRHKYIRATTRMLIGHRLTD